MKEIVNRICDRKRTDSQFTVPSADEKERNRGGEGSLCGLSAQS